jgi:transposase-like protein
MTDDLVPVEFHPDFTAIARQASERGATLDELADVLGTSRRTLNRWRVQHSEFGEAIKVGADADDRVEASLFEAACGYARTLERAFIVDGQVVKTTVVEQVGPDAAACTKWLHNRRPSEWRNRDRADVSVAVGVGVQVGAAEGGPTQADLARMSVDELQREYNAALSRISIE